MEELKATRISSAADDLSPINPRTALGQAYIRNDRKYSKKHMIIADECHQLYDPKNESFLEDWHKKAQGKSS